LHESIDNKQLYDTFSLFGNILSCKVVTDRESGKSMGYGYVHYETAEAANAAIDKLDGMLIDGQEVQVGHFMRKNDRPGLSDWTNCYCKNIPLDWNNARLNEEFSKFGEVLSATVAMGIPKDKLKAERRKKAEERKEKKEEKKEKKDEGESKEESKKDGEKEAEGKETDDNGGEAKEEGADGDKKEAEKTGEGNGKVEKKIQSLGYGFVSFADHDSAVAAVENLNGTTVYPVADGDSSYELFVCRAQKKAERERELRAKFESIKLERISKFQGVNLYVKNLDDTVTDDILREEFSQMGTITSARVMREIKDGRSRGFGFVCFSCPEEATRAVNEMNGKLIINKPIFVALAQRKDVRRAQLEAQHSNRGSSNQGQQPSAGMIRGPMATPMGYPGAAMPVYMQRPGPGGNMQPVYPMMPQMMPGATASGQQPRAAAGQQPRGYPMMQQQRGVYPMPTYGVVPQQPARGGRGPSQGGRGGRGGRSGPGGMQQPRGAVPGRGGAGPQQQQPNNIKFNQQARNASGPPAPVPPAPLQQPPPPPQQVPPPASESALTASALASASPEQQKNMIGERLYPLIHASQPDLAGKITGMLLEMDNSELLHLLESPEALNSKITEALQVLEAHNAATSSAQT
jgi:polyadenylate-binding protein